MSGERAGMPSVGIMTDGFVTAAELMCRVLGADEYRFVVIPHPISSASPESLDAAARQAAADCVDLLTQSAG